MKRERTLALKLALMAAGAVATGTAVAALTVDLSRIDRNKAETMSSLLSAVRGTDVYDVKNHTLVQLPHAFIDRVFAIPSGQLIQIPLTLHREGGDDADLPPEVTIVVRTVPGIRLSPGNGGVSLVKRESVRDGLVEYRFRYVTSWGIAPKDRKYSYDYRTPALLAETDLEPSQRHYPFVFWMDYGNLTSVPQRMEFSVIPAIRARQPRTFQTGIVQYGLQIPEEHTRRYAEFLRDCGLNAVSIIYRVNYGCPANAVTADLPRDFKAVGITRYGEFAELVDGIGIGDRPIPLEHSLRVSDGSPFTWGYARYTCPYAVYSKGPFYSQNLIPMLRRVLVTEDKADHILPNWEPFKLGLDYCFCRNCKREFAKFARLPEDAVQALSGEDLRKKYGSLWMRYCSAAHGKLMRAIQDAVDEACAGTGKRPLFLPEVNVESMMPLLDKGRQDSFGHYDARNYVRDLPGVCPWAPYNYYHANAPFRHLAGYHLNIVRCAEFFHRYYPGTKIYFLVHGYQCCTWLTMPEAISFETFGLFLAGMSGSFVYKMDGYDARYYAALAKCNDMIAGSEDFVRTATVETNLTCTALSPVPPLFVSRSYPRFMQRLAEGATVLYPRAFRKDGSVMAFLGNSWSGGEIYCRLKVSNLPEGPCVVELSGTGRRFCLTARDLAERGLVLCVDPLDWLKVTVRPGAEEGGVRAENSDRDLLSRIEKDRQRLQTACDGSGRSAPVVEDGLVDEIMP